MINRLFYLINKFKDKLQDQRLFFHTDINFIFLQLKAPEKSEKFESRVGDWSIPPLIENKITSVFQVLFKYTHTNMKSFETRFVNLDEAERLTLNEYLLDPEEDLYVRLCVSRTVQPILNKIRIAQRHELSVLQQAMQKTEAALMADNHNNKPALVSLLTGYSEQIKAIQALGYHDYSDECSWVDSALQLAKQTTYVLSEEEKSACKTYEMQHLVMPVGSMVNFLLTNKSGSPPQKNIAPRDDDDDDDEDDEQIVNNHHNIGPMLQTLLLRIKLKHKINEYFNSNLFADDIPLFIMACRQGLLLLETEEHTVLHFIEQNNAFMLVELLKAGLIIDSRIYQSTNSLIKNNDGTPIHFTLQDWCHYYASSACIAKFNNSGFLPLSEERLKTVAEIKHHGKGGLQDRRNSRPPPPNPSVASATNNNTNNNANNNRDPISSNTAVNQQARNAELNDGQSYLFPQNIFTSLFGTLSQNANNNNNPKPNPKNKKNKTVYQ